MSTSKIQTEFNKHFSLPKGVKASKPTKPDEPDEKKRNKK
jgi:hypothetical protein